MGKKVARRAAKAVPQKKVIAVKKAAPKKAVRKAVRKSAVKPKAKRVPTPPKARAAPQHPTTKPTIPKAAPKKKVPKAVATGPQGYTPVENLKFKAFKAQF